MSQLNVDRINLSSGLKIPEYSGTLPASGNIGSLLFDQSVEKIKVWDGAGWKSFSATTSASGGSSVTDTGGYRIHTFTGDGVFTVVSGGIIEYLVVGGGAAGGSRHGGGGGAGGVLRGVMEIASGSYAITIGNGGAKSGADGVRGASGGNTVFGPLIAFGGSGGGVWAGVDPIQGGCGGGAGGGSGSNRVREYGGLGIPGQGQNGGTGIRYLIDNTNAHAGGGGGGAGVGGEDGWDANQSVSNGNGGDGIQSDIDGTNYWYAGGGGGGVYQGNLIGGNGGKGGGGGGAHYFSASQNGAGDTNGRNNGGNASRNTGGDGGANTGGGGGANGGQVSDGGLGGNGGSGIVIIRYAT